MAAAIDNSGLVTGFEYLIDSIHLPDPDALMAAMSLQLPFIPVRV